MTTRVSNSRYLTVLDPLPLENIGWTLRVRSERDYTTQIALPSRFIGIGFTKEKNAEGGGSITVDPDDPIWAALPETESTPIFEQEALWQFVEDGVVRFEILHEDTEEQEIPDGGGARVLKISGRGTGLVLDWARVLPADGYTTNVQSLTRKFNAHPMAVWHRLFSEAQALGFCDWVRPLFDAAADSTGRPWGPTQSVEVSLGDSLLDLLKRWCEANDLVWRMLPGFRLWVGQTEGNRLEQTVRFTEWKAIKAADKKVTRREIATEVWVASGEKGVSYATDPAARAKWRRRMAWMTAGNADDATGRSAVANSTLALRKTQQVSRTLKVPNLATPRRLFVDYDVTDWVGFDQRAADGTVTVEARQVVAVTVDINEDGIVDVELTSQSRFESRAEKIKRALDKLGASATDTAASPIPVSKTVSAVGLDDLIDVDTTGKQVGDTFRWDGTNWVDVTPNLNWLADVDTVAKAPTHGQALVYDATAGLWKPGDAAGGGIRDRRWAAPATWLSVDEFNDDVLDPAWVRADGTGALAANADWRERGDVLSLQQNGGDAASKVRALLRPLTGAGGPVAVGDAFVTCLTLFGPPGVNYTMGGLMLSDTAVHGNGRQIITLNYFGAGASQVNDTRQSTGFGIGTASTNVSTPSGVRTFLRLVQVAAGVWRCDVSPDGVSWLSSGTNTFALTPTHVGFISSSWGTGTRGVVAYEFLRRMAGVS